MFKKLGAFALLMAFCLQIIAGVVNAADSNYDIDFSDSKNGIVNVLFENSSDKKFKLVVLNNDTSEKYVYDLSDNSEYVSFPLQLGNGEYSVSIYENTSGTKYKLAYDDTKDITVKEELDIYLNSVQVVSWDEDDQAIQLAEELLEKSVEEKNTVAQINTTIDSEMTVSMTLSDAEKIQSIYTYIIENYTYDYAKITTLDYDYIPDINDVYNEKEGICFDYSVLFASMLRSQGIPTKLIKGYTTNVDAYHAWNEVYIEDEERWIIIDTTFDAYKLQNGFDYNMEKPSEDYAATSIY